MKLLNVFYFYSLLFFSLFVISSCNEDVLEESKVSELAFIFDDATGAMPTSACYKIVFPVTVILPDGTTQLVNSHDEYNRLVRKNLGRQDRGLKISIQMPYDIQLRDGSLVTIDSQSKLDEIIRNCNRNNYDRACYQINFPVTLVFSDQSTKAVNNQDELNAAIREWLAAGNKTRPEIQFPYTVTLKDGSIVTINSSDDLKAILENCHKPKHREPRFVGCYELQFPLTVKVGRDQTITVNSKEELERLRKSGNPRANDIKIEFPYSVIFIETGETIIINSSDDLRALIERCKSE